MNEYPMCEVPRIDWMSGEPASALISGSVTSRLEQLRAARPLRVDDDLRIGDVGNGVERRGAERVDAERRRSAATRQPDEPPEPDDELDDGGDHAVEHHEPLQLVLGVDEEAAEGDDLLAVLQAVEHLGEQLALDAGLNLPRRVAAVAILARRRCACRLSSMIASFGTDRNRPCSITISIT